MTEAFSRAEIDSPRLCAEMLLSHVIGCDRLRLYMEADRPASPLERENLRSLVARALKHEPVQYLVGEAWFFSLPLRADSRALIPRPSTETLVETILRHARMTPGFDRATIADVCAGGGCIAVALLKNLPDARAAACDISLRALELARENAHRHGVGDRMDFLDGDLLDPLLRHPAGRDLHYLVANPPYIPDHEWEAVLPNVKDFEPESALRGGPDGLQFVRPLLEQGPARLRPGGVMAIEIAASTAELALELASAQSGLEAPRIENDLDGLPRVLIARRRETRPAHTEARVSQPIRHAPEGPSAPRPEAAPSGTV